MTPRASAPAGRASARRRASPAARTSASVLQAADAEAPLGELRRVLDDLREAHDGHDVVVGDLPPVDLLEEVLHLLVAAELGVVVLDVAGRQLTELLDLDLVDHGLEDLLAGRVLVPDRDHDGLVLLVLVRLVAEADRGGLAAALELV